MAHPGVATCPSVKELLAQGTYELEESGRVLRKNRENSMLLCKSIARDLQVWKWTVAQEKSVYTTLNLFKVCASPPAFLLARRLQPFVR
jgi:hypothetical protein